MFNITALIEIFIIFLTFFVVRYISYKITNEIGLPKWLDYQPWICDTCLTFWTLITIYISIFLIIEAYVTLIGGISLAILNAIAMKVEQRNKTIKI